MTVIFKDLDVETLMKKASGFFAKCFKFAKGNRIAVKILSLALIFFFIVVVDTVAVGLRIGFNVKYEGKVIATVENRSVSDDARDIAVNNVNSKGASGVIAVPKLTLTITVEDKFDTVNKVADAIIDNTDDVVEAKELIVDGKGVAVSDHLNIEKLLEERKAAFNKPNAENTAEFTNNVEVKEGLYIRKDLSTYTEVKQIIDGLEVKTTSKFITDTILRYRTRTERTSKQPVGYSKITTVGKNGLSRAVKLTESINGQEVSTEVLDTEVVTTPVDEVVLVGTKATSSSASSSTSSAGFIFPLPRGSYKVSSYWGDGRGHKGVDLCANKGVSIYAVAAGTVEYAGYKGDYGYSVVVNHGNGIKTRYAHASVLCVKAGDTVTQGQMVAAVGNTGNSYGNHLHFEVIVNGTRVNPAPYINLR